MIETSLFGPISVRVSLKVRIIWVRVCLKLLGCAICLWLGSDRTLRSVAILNMKKISRRKKSASCFLKGRQEVRRIAKNIPVIVLLQMIYEKCCSRTRTFCFTFLLYIVLRNLFNRWFEIPVDSRWDRKRMNIQRKLNKIEEDDEIKGFIWLFTSLQLKYNIELFKRKSN